MMLIQTEFVTHGVTDLKEERESLLGKAIAEAAKVEGGEKALHGWANSAPDQKGLGVDAV
jgi:hypothetical protein